MRTQVLEFLRDLPKTNREKFNKAFDFLSQTKGISFNQQLSYNAQGATDSNIRNMIYDLKKHHKITDVEVLRKKDPILKKIEETIDINENVDQNTVLRSKTDNPSDSEETKKTDLHKEFPFLTSKDCPAELHVVSGQLVASWKRYNALFAKLQAVNEGEIELSSDEKVSLVAETNKEFENNDGLFKELVHFRDHSAILGNHEVLKAYKAQKEIDEMTTEDLVKYKTNIPTYLSKAKKELLRTDLTDVKRAKTESKIEEWEIRLALVIKKLGIAQ